MIESKKIFKEQDNNIPIFATKLPDTIIKEIDEWVEECRKIKNHKLSELKHHDNAGNKHNTYQVSVPKYLIDRGFFLAYLLRFASKSFGESHRKYQMREHKGHFDGYDIWVNFTYHKDDNPTHNHNGDYSGIIYYKNDDTPTIFTDFKVGYSGVENTMLLFPSNIFHKVEEKQSISERITIAFNLNKVL
jgi:hypothetical protein